MKKWIPEDAPCYYLDVDVKIHRSSLLLKLIYDATYLKKADEYLV